MQRAFTSLTAQEVLGIAISIEERNAGIYHRLAEMFTEFGDGESLEIASVFWEMAVEERGHHAMLQQKYLEQYGVTNRSYTEEDLVELIEVPRLNLGEVFGDDNRFSARQRALRVALQAENNARQFYSKLAEESPKSPLRQTYSDLALMEEGHVAYLEEKLEEDSAGKPTLQ